MGFGFHTSTSLKENRALLKKRKGFKEVRAQFHGLIDKAELHFKELTDFEKKKLRDQIRARAKKERYVQIKASLLSIAIIAFVLFAVYLLLT